VRAADFGGDYAETRAEADDGRNSIAMPIQVNGQVLGCVNLTWRMSVLTVQQVTSRHLAELQAAVQAIGKRAAAAGVGMPARWD
jgi:IclR family mhp operon transcriptional activator